jgi:anti-sigma B factor antagonist
MRTVPEQHSDAEPPQLRVHHQVLDEAVVVTATGEVDMNSVAGLEDQLTSALDTAAVVVVDLTGVSFLDSTGLSTLLRAHELSGRNGHAFRVVVATRAVERPLCATSLDRLLDLYPTLTDALAGR